RGAKELKEAIYNRLSLPSHACCSPVEAGAPAAGAVVAYPEPIQAALDKIEAELDDSYRLSRHATALLLLQNDPEVLDLARAQSGERFAAITEIIQETQNRYSQPLTYVITRQYREAAQRILKAVLELPQQKASGFAARLSDLMIRPLTGLPILLVALFVLYEFVGVLGSQILVNLLEKQIFGAYVNPLVNRFIDWLIPWAVLRDLIAGQYGIITLGVRYAVAIILPIVGTFFIAFSIIEDSGYLPRLAMLIDRVFKRIGLNGRAVIPMVLGFGCDTMATIVTRTLETRRERILSTILLSLAIPCSAQLGVMLGLLSGRPDLLAIWFGIVAAVFMLVGFLAARLMPGERPTFYMELPPLRLPTLRNVFVKTYTRMEWYLREVFPLFIIASVVIWFGRLTGLFDVAVRALEPMVTWIGLPKETAVAFLFGFFRRDYGAAGLYDLRSTMSAAQLLVATVTMTLFIPCIAQFSVTAKERGWKMAVAIAIFIFPFALAVGALLNLVLKVIPIAL
ncbi:MAG TPA: ferrous iron transporter B, partial [Anaerolineales bacterium]